MAVPIGYPNTACTISISGETFHSKKVPFRNPDDILVNCTLTKLIQEAISKPYKWFTETLNTSIFEDLISYQLVYLLICLQSYTSKSNPSQESAYEDLLEPN